jgi:hypothetical protein
MKQCLHQVVAKFLMMPVMKNYDYGGFSTLFNKLAITFKESLNKTHLTVSQESVAVQGRLVMLILKREHF